uniref:Uncharacterized protein n=1 Tax=Cyprinus carpio TaxID=7962 RepID=A0A8C2FDM1_CYPCA
MDSPSGDDLLQKTSPQPNPAAYDHLCATMAAQASQIAANQHQLNHLTSITEQLVKAVQNLHSTAVTSPPPAAATIAHAAGTPAQVNPRLAYPEKFDGDSTKCKGFLLQCSLFVEQQPTLYTTDAGKIAFVCSLLTGRALEWITAVWREDGTAFTTFTDFLVRFREVFDHPREGKGAGERLLELSQGGLTAAEYAMNFRTLAAQTSWVSDTLKVLFRKGLNHELQTELACRDEGRTLSDLISLTITIDNLQRSRRVSAQRLFPVTTTRSAETTEPMQINSYHLTAEERHRRMSNRLCLYCGAPGHQRITCPSRRSSCTPKSVSASFNCVSVPLVIKTNNVRVATTALLDSGAAGNFISEEFAKRNNISLISCTNSLSVATIDGRPLGSGLITHRTQELQMLTGLLHQETIQFYVLPVSNPPVIFGLPWLRLHDPQVSWREGQILRWSTQCQKSCLPTISPMTVQVVTLDSDSTSIPNLPKEYHDLATAFSKVQANTSRLWKAFFQALDVNVSLTSGYHPQSNGQVERLNQELTRFLRSYCSSNQEDWARYLLWAEYAQNSLVKPATGITPFKCILGYQPPMFPWSGEPTDVPAVTDWLQRSEETWNQAHVHLQRAIRHQKEHADHRRRPGPVYQPGQYVWLSTRDLRLRLPCKKLSPRYVGPFKITHQITPVSFRLALPDTYRISPTFHVSLLKPAVAPGEEGEGRSREQSPQPVQIETEETYQVRELLNSRRRGRILQYLVDWEGYGPEEQSWVNADNILDPNLITEFHRLHPERPAPRPRGRPRRRLPSRARSRSQGGGSVTETNPVIPATGQQRAPSPEY